MNFLSYPTFDGDINHRSYGNLECGIKDSDILTLTDTLLSGKRF